VRLVALDLTDTYRAGLSPRLSHAKHVADPFHVTQGGQPDRGLGPPAVAERPAVTSRPQGRPLFKIRKLSLKGSERLDQQGRERMLLGLRLGDPDDELLGAWLAKESVRDVYLTTNPAEAAVLLHKAIIACRAGDVAEINSLGRTLARWRKEILKHHRTAASNGPTQGMNFCAKRVKRGGRRFSTLKNCRLRVLLYAGGVAWPTIIQAPRLSRTRLPLIWEEPVYPTNGHRLRSAKAPAPRPA
jgi:hypothetical protein